MAERAYTFSEVEAMRTALHLSYPWYGSFNHAERCREVEDRVRTLMAGNVDPHDVVSSCEAQRAGQQKLAQQMAEQYASAELEATRAGRAARAAHLSK